MKKKLLIALALTTLVGGTVGAMNMNDTPEVQEPVKSVKVEPVTNSEPAETVVDEPAVQTTQAPQVTPQTTVQAPPIQRPTETIEPQRDKNTIEGVIEIVYGNFSTEYKSRCIECVGMYVAKNPKFMESNLMSTIPRLINTHGVDGICKLVENS